MCAVTIVSLDFILRRYFSAFILELLLFCCSFVARNMESNKQQQDERL